MNDAKRRFELYSSQIKLTKQSLEFLMAEYTSASIRFEEVLRMQQQALDYELKLVESEVDRETAIAKVANLIGR